MDKESRRTNPRLAINMKVKITAGNYNTMHLITENCSDGGIFVTDDRLAEMQVGSDVEVQADKGVDDQPIIKARIAWTNSQGAGLEYIINE
ncbi:MAG: hypothetical protein COB38_04820 [Gammaproteobacteria bacterium]|nr:MAG: hypothetical protein COB38_04820 [Gammaproteobacteria bacterium]